MAERNIPRVQLRSQRLWLLIAGAAISSAVAGGEGNCPVTITTRTQYRNATEAEGDIRIRCSGPCQLWVPRPRCESINVIPAGQVSLRSTSDSPLGRFSSDRLPTCAWEGIGKPAGPYRIRIPQGRYKVRLRYSLNAGADSKICIAESKDFELLEPEEWEGEGEERWE